VGGPERSHNEDRLKPRDLIQAEAQPGGGLEYSVPFELKSRMRQATDVERRTIPPNGSANRRGKRRLLL